MSNDKDVFCAYDPSAVNGKRRSAMLDPTGAIPWQISMIYAVLRLDEEFGVAMQDDYVLINPVYDHLVLGENVTRILDDDVRRLWEMRESGRLRYESYRDRVANPFRVRFMRVQELPEPLWNTEANIAFKTDEEAVVWPTSEYDFQSFHHDGTPIVIAPPDYKRSA